MKTLYCFLLLLLAAGATAAPPDYRVYYVKGMAKKKPAMRMLQRGDSLYVQDVLELAGNAEVYLLCRDYSLVQLKKPGSYVLRTAAPCPSGGGSLTASYFRYVWDELRSHGSPEQNPRHYMNNVGAVSRGECGADPLRSPLALDLIYSGGGNLPLYWSSPLDTAFLTVFAGKNDPRILYQAQLVKGQPLALTDLQAANAEATEIYWTIGARNAPACGARLLQLLAAPEYRDRVSVLLQQVVATTPAETALMKGFLLEEAHFLQEALLYYAEAFRLDPNNRRAKAALFHYYEHPQ